MYKPEMLHSSDG